MRIIKKLCLTMALCLSIATGVMAQEVDSSIATINHTSFQYYTESIDGITTVMSSVSGGNFDNKDFGELSKLEIDHVFVQTWSANNYSLDALSMYYIVYKETEGLGSKTHIPLLVPEAEGHTDTIWDWTSSSSETRIDLLSGLEPGDYIIDVYFDVDVLDSNGFLGKAIDSNGGANYKAKVKVVEEPGYREINYVTPIVDRETEFYEAIKELDFHGGGKILIDAPIRITNIHNVDSNYLEENAAVVGAADNDDNNDDEDKENDRSALKIPQNIDLVFGKNGALDIGQFNSKSSAHEKLNYIFVEGRIIASPTQIFKGSGYNLIKNKNTLTEEIYPEWWGAIGGDDADDYSGLRTAIIDYQSDGLESIPVVIAQKFNLNSNINQPKYGNLKFKKGGRLSVDSGKTLNIDGEIEAGLYKIFEGNGTIKGFIGNSAYPEWWGAHRDDDSVDHAAIQEAIDFVSYSGGGVVYFSAGTYLISETIKLKSQVTLKGVKAENGWARIGSEEAGKEEIIESYDNIGSRIMVKDSIVDEDGKGIAVDVVLIKDIYHWGLQDLIIDGNEHNQSDDVKGSHGIKVQGEGKVYAGIISGCKVVNPVEFALYTTNSNTMEITENLFMSGVLISHGADINFTQNSVDGTHGKHPALYLNNLDSCNFADNLCWGWGEYLSKAEPEKSQWKTRKYELYEIEKVGIAIEMSSTVHPEFDHLPAAVTTDATILVFDDAKVYKESVEQTSVSVSELLYEGMPVRLVKTNGSSVPYPNLEFESYGSTGVSYVGEKNELLSGGTYFLHKDIKEIEGEDNQIDWELWDQPYGTKAAHKVIFPSVAVEGVGEGSSDTQWEFTLLYGDKSAALMTKCRVLNIDSNRFAGSTKNALTIYDAYDLMISNSTFWRMNVEGKGEGLNNTEAAALALYDARSCTIQGNSFGEQDVSEKHKAVGDKSNIDYGLYFGSVNNTWDIAQNIVGVNNYEHVKSSYIKDDFEGDYRLRNYITRPQTPSSSSIKSIEYKKWHDELINKDLYVEMNFDETGINTSISDKTETILVLYENENPYNNTITQSDLPSSDPNYQSNDPVGTGATKFEIEPHSKYQINGQIAFTATNEGDIRVNVEYLKEDSDNSSANIKKTFVAKYNVRDVAHSDPNNWTYYYTIPINFDFLVEELDASYGAIRIRVYQNTDSSINFKKENELSWLTLKKTGQIQYND